MPPVRLVHPISPTPRDKPLSAGTECPFLSMARGGHVLKFGDRDNWDRVGFTCLHPVVSAGMPSTPLFVVGPPQTVQSLWRPSAGRGAVWAQHAPQDRYAD